MSAAAKLKARDQARLRGRRAKYARRLLKGYRAYLATPDCQDFAEDPDVRKKMNELFRSQFMPQFEGTVDDTFIQRDLPWLSDTAREMITDAINHRPTKHYTEKTYLLQSLIPLHSIPFTLVVLSFVLCKRLPLSLQSCMHTHIIIQGRVWFQFRSAVPEAGRPFIVDH
jgi:hypothetical protein